LENEKKDSGKEKFRVPGSQRGKSVNSYVFRHGEGKGVEVVRWEMPKIMQRVKREEEKNLEVRGGTRAKIGKKGKALSANKRVNSVNGFNE